MPPTTTHDQPDISQVLDTLPTLLSILKAHNLTIMSLPSTSTPSHPTSFHDFIPPVPIFTGTPSDTLTIDEWRVRMRLKLRQMSQIPGLETSDMFKANYILSMFSGPAFEIVKVKWLKSTGRNSTTAVSNLESTLEAMCDAIRDGLPSVGEAEKQVETSEKVG